MKNYENYEVGKNYVLCHCGSGTSVHGKLVELVSIKNGRYTFKTLNKQYQPETDKSINTKYNFKLETRLNVLKDRIQILSSIGRATNEFKFMRTIEECKENKDFCGRLQLNI